MTRTLRDLRLLRLFDQQMLGERVGVNAVTISRWETCEHKPSLRNIHKLAKALDMEPEEVGHAVEATFVQKQQRSKIPQALAQSA